MNNQFTMKELQEKVQAYASDCADAYTESQRLRFNTHGCLVYPTKESKYDTSMQGKINDHAFSQIIERLDAPPMTWIGNPKRCNMELRAKILNNLAVDRPNTGLFVRSKGDHVRAVMSSQYTKFDNPNLVDRIAEAIDSQGVEVAVLRPYVGDELSAYILFQSITFDYDPSYRGKNNGGLHPAVYVTNSEIGTGSARIVGGLYRGFCGNGSIHGWQAEDVLAVRHRYLSEYAMRSIVASGIATAMHMSEEAAHAYVAAQEIAIEEVSLKGIINEWANKYGLTVSAKENWLKSVASEVSVQERDEPMLIDVFNAATFSAHSIENNREREMVERMAGDMLSSYIRPRQRED